jgi:hypothetical protein
MHRDRRAGQGDAGGFVIDELHSANASHRALQQFQNYHLKINDLADRTVLAFDLAAVA